MKYMVCKILKSILKFFNLKKMASTIESSFICADNDINLKIISQTTAVVSPSGVVNWMGINITYFEETGGGPISYDLIYDSLPDSSGNINNSGYHITKPSYPTTATIMGTHNGLLPFACITLTDTSGAAHNITVSSMDSPKTWAFYNIDISNIETTPVTITIINGHCV